MLTRRHIRIKVMQGLYGFYQVDDKDLARSVTQLKNSLEGIYSLYLYELKALVLILRLAEERIEKNKKKHLPTKEDLKPNSKLVENIILRELADNILLAKEFESLNINWNEYRDMFIKIFNEILKSEEYADYMIGPKGVREDKRIVKYIYGTYIANNENIHAIYEEMNLHWADDLDAAQMMVVKTIKVFIDIDGKAISKVNFSTKAAEKVFETSKLPKGFLYADQKVTVNLFKDKSDRVFGPDLFIKTINNSKKQDELIEENTKNWEADRIAILDNVLMKMAQTELTEFNEIPMRVSLNEYIELSKMYSTPKSSQFINGVLDQIALTLKSRGEINKIGRGLM